MKKQSSLKNKNGMAVIEALLMMVVFLTLFWYTIGFWGVTHTAILQSISARNYAVEIFRHRSNLWYFRGNRASPLKYHPTSVRLHGVNTDAGTGVVLEQYATERRVAMFQENETEGRSSNEHQKAQGEVQVGTRNDSISVDPVWIKIQYGICLTAECGD